MTKSKQPKKQRKFWYNAPLHRRAKIMSVQLSPELREKYGFRSIPIARGDSVIIRKGDFKGLEGTVEKVNRKTYRVYISGVNVEKVDGTTIQFPIYYSNLMITKLNLKDKWRKRIIERRQKALVESGGVE